jgi:hypothetical protein
MLTATLIQAYLLHFQRQFRGRQMICGLSTISLVLGTAIAYLAHGHPKHQIVMETVAGFLLIGGLGMMGYALEAVLGRP